MHAKCDLNLYKRVDTLCVDCAHMTVNKGIKVYASIVSFKHVNESYMNKLSTNL